MVDQNAIAESDGEGKSDYEHNRQGRALRPRVVVLKGKGVELQDGLYTQRIQQGCEILANTINGSRDALERAKAEADRRLDEMRQVIHEKTAPKHPAGSPPPPSEPAAARAKKTPAPAKAPSAAKVTPTKPKPRAAQPKKRGSSR